MCVWNSSGICCGLCKKKKKDEKSASDGKGSYKVRTYLQSNLCSMLDIAFLGALLES